MKNTFKKALSLALTVVMLLGMLPSAALADYSNTLQVGALPEDGAASEEVLEEVLEDASGITLGSDGTVRYTVNYFLEEPDNPGYYSYLTKETKYAVPNTTVSAADAGALSADIMSAGGSSEEYRGFTLNADKSTSGEVTVAEDGSTVINLYYARNTYKVEFYKNNAVIDDYTITALYGANISTQWPGGDWKVEPNTTTTQMNIGVMPYGGAKFYYKLQGSDTHYVRFFVDVETGVKGYTGEVETTTYKGKTYYLHHYDTANEYYDVTKEDYYDLSGFGASVGQSYTNAGCDSTGGWTTEYSKSPKFFYNANTYTITLEYGAPYSGTIDTLKLDGTTDIKYSLSLSSLSLPGTVAEPAGASADCKFTGWYLDPNCTQAASLPATMPNHNLVFYAGFESPAVEYGTITYPEYPGDNEPEKDPSDKDVDVQKGKTIQVNPNGGTWDDAVEGATKGTDGIYTVKVSEDISLGTASREGYIFRGWEKTDGTDGVTYVFTAKWRVNTHSITYKIDGTVVESFGESSVDYGAKKTTATAETRTGYVFSGWSSDDVTVGTDGSFTMPNKDVTFTGSYTLDTVAGEITITAKSDSKTYDGTPLTNAGYTYTDGILKEGDVLTAVVEGTITDAGTAANKVTSYKVMRGETDVTACYTFDASVDGALTINKRAVTLTSTGGSKVYDGTPLTKDEVTVTSGSFVDGQGFTATATGRQTVAGSSDNTFTYKLNEGTNKDNYDITKVEGKLTVSPVTAQITVTITENSGTYTYDGTEKTVTGYEVSISQQIYTKNDFTFSGTAEVKGTDAGTYNMDVKSTDFTNNSSNFSNVKFVVEGGTLTIT